MPLDRGLRDLYAWRRRVGEHEIVPGVSVARLIGDFLVCLREHPDPLPVDPVRFLGDFIGAYLRRILSDRLAVARQDRDRLQQEVAAARVAADAATAAAAEEEARCRAERRGRAAAQREVFVRRRAVAASAAEGGFAAPPPDAGELVPEPITVAGQSGLSPEDERRLLAVEADEAEAIAVVEAELAEEAAALEAAEAADTAAAEALWAAELVARGLS